MAATDQDFEPDPEQQALLPDITGNEINGLGEAARRRPTVIYWNDPSTLAFGELMLWYVRRNYQDEALRIRKNAEAIDAEALAPVADARAPAPSGGWTEDLKHAGLRLGAGQVGVARVDPAWVFDRYEVDLPWIVVLAAPMDYDVIATSPSAPALNEVLNNYNEMYTQARDLANWIRGKGWRADSYGGFVKPDPMLIVPAAIASGIGELGKHGSLISRHYGACFRLSFVLTDMPLVADRPDAFGVDEFCMHCRLCESECPPGAIAPHKQTVRGDHKWYVDFDRCVPYFNENHGCGICIAVCPWSRPGVAPKLAQKMIRRKS
jgi:Pyruvate/2-oxoacid:ferredoxin oxidoreductase delta subunit